MADTRGSVRRLGYHCRPMQWYEILAVSLAVWLTGSVLLSLVLGRIFAAQGQSDRLSR